MNQSRCILFVLFFLLMGTCSWAEENVKIQEPRCGGGYPGNIIVGGGEHSFTAGFEFFWGNNVLYCSESSASNLWHPNHWIIWTMHAHYLYVNRMGSFLQPNVQYIYRGGPRLNVTIGPEVGVWVGPLDFDYGVSTRVGTLYNLVNVELGYMVNSNVLYLNFLLSLSWGYPY